MPEHRERRRQSAPGDSGPGAGVGPCGSRGLGAPGSAGDAGFGCSRRSWGERSAHRIRWVLLPVRRWLRSPAHHSQPPDIAPSPRTSLPAPGHRSRPLPTVKAAARQVRSAAEDAGTRRPSRCSLGTPQTPPVALVQMSSGSTCPPKIPAMPPGSSAAVGLGFSQWDWGSRDEHSCPNMCRGHVPTHGSICPLLGQMSRDISGPAGTLGTARFDSRNIAATHSRPDWEPQGGVQAHHSQTPSQAHRAGVKACH